MRLELGLREAVVERCGPLLAELERLTSELVSRPPREGSLATSCDAIVGVLETLRLACATVPALEPVTPLLDVFKTLVVGVRQGEVSLTARHAALLTSAVAALTQAVNNLGTESRAAKLVPKALAEVTRLLKALAPVAAPAPVATPVVDLARAFRESFLEDEDGNFTKIAELARSLGGVSTTADATAVEELFRQVHTVKGNAMALGLTGLANFAHSLEAELDRARTQSSLSAEAARALAESADTLLVLRERSRGDTQPAVPTGERASFLSVRRGGREWLLPCAQVTEVLRRPRVLALPRRPGAPEAPGDTLLGAVRSRGLFVPLIGGREIGRQSPPWAVVLKESDNASGLVCIPVDEVGAVQELAGAPEPGRLLELTRVTGKAA